MKCSTVTSRLGLVLCLSAGAGATRAQNMVDLDLRTLMDMEITVTSVAKKSTRLLDSAAAVTVITQDDIRRLGITRIPEALRLVPGLDVARINANIWAVSARGFNQQYANKLLVLIDGRTVFTPTFGGVYWDAQDLLLEDIDRIEVIRGPGATLWGANAVNGVINIRTKAAGDTEGGLLAGAGGTEVRPMLSARYGAALANDIHYRVYSKYVDGDGLVDSEGRDAPDQSHSLRAGFRADWARTARDALTLQGDAYSAREGENVVAPSFTAPFSDSLDVRDAQNGANLLGRWTRTLSDTSHATLQTYVDHFRHEGARTIEWRDTFDVQWEHRLPVGLRHDVIWGLGYRFSSDEFNQTSTVHWDPARRDLNLYTTFVQDEIALVPQQVSLTLGSKFEHNDYTGFETQPSVALRWTPREHHTLWASISDAVSTPARYNRDARITLNTFQTSPISPVFEIALSGDADVNAERLRAYEAGYRFEIAAYLSVDLATFYNRYRDVMISAPAATQLELAPIPHVVIGQTWANDLEGHTYGGEAAIQWQPLDVWRLTAAYGYLTTRVGNEFFDHGSPEQQVNVRSYLNLSKHAELNGAVYYVDRITALQGLTPVTIGSYVRVDAGLTWRPRTAVELGVWGQNLLDTHHPESPGLNTTFITEVPRTVLARVAWQF